MRRCPLPWNTEMAAFSRYTPLATALVLLAMSVPAAAQVTINMTTAQGAGCTATTDGNGLVLAPGGTDLTATGVNLSADHGCGIAAGLGNPRTWARPRLCERFADREKSRGGNRVVR